MSEKHDGTSAHALLSASDAARWGTCAPALRETRNAPDSSSAAADWGTAGHEVGAWCLTNKAQAEQYPHAAVAVGSKEWKVDREMCECVNAYLEFVRERIEDGELLVEQRVAYGTYLLGDSDISLKALDKNDVPYEHWVHPNDIAYGTSDAVILGDEHLRIIDLKTGANPNNKVEADHPQLKLYALGCLYEYGMVSDFKRVTVSICQPRVDHYPEHTYEVQELLDWADEMAPKAMLALEWYGSRAAPDLADFTLSDKGCQWCGNRAHCPAQVAEIETETRDFFAPMVVQSERPNEPAVERERLPAEVPEIALSRYMSLADRAEGWIKAVRAETERRLIFGLAVPGYKLVQGRRGPRAWTDPDAAEAALKSFRMKQEEMYSFALLSPTQIEKELAAKNPKRWAKLQSLIGQTDGKPSVAPVSDKRPALVVSSVDETFSALASAEDLV